ncbi:hypothetical protein [Curvibacter lanceolatus]|uniref:hypothetical protein n=1 Tax=Curvibacter lanceolatus TaxID=86182 RepID=UPI00036BED88|nr:hypothetical protein [Curvibacter lanceolatus]
MNFFQYLALIKAATPLAIEATKAIQQAVPNVAGTAKLQFVLSAVQSGLQTVSNVTATVDQLTPIINAAVTLHKAVGTDGFQAAAATAAST